ncbi:hypothetical protein BJY59DRAFT_654525 [Rhodotorula toruloides]
MLAPTLRTTLLSSRALSRRTYASVGGSTSQPIADGAKDLGGKAQDNSMKIVLAAALAVGGGAVWWKSAKTEGTDPLKPPITQKASSDQPQLQKKTPA